MGIRDDLFERVDADLRGVGDELEQRQADAEVDASENELESLRQVRAQHAQLRKDVDDATRGDERSMQTAKQKIKDRFDELKARVQEYRGQAGARHRAYDREQDASLLEMGAEIDAADAAIQRGDADTALMTRAEVAAIKEQLRATRDGFKRLVGQEDAPNWAQVREEYEVSWRALKAKADVLNRLPTPGQQPGV